MATGRLTISVNGVTLADIENEIRTDGRNEILNINFEVQHETLTFVPGSDPILLLGPTPPSREENGRRV